MSFTHIRRLRKKKGMTQNQLAAAAGVTQSTLSDIESGKRDDPSINIMRKIAVALEISLDDLTKESSTNDN